MSNSPCVQHYKRTVTGARYRVKGFSSENQAHALIGTASKPGHTRLNALIFETAFAKFHPSTPLCPTVLRCLYHHQHCIVEQALQKAVAEGSRVMQLMQVRTHASTARACVPCRGFPVPGGQRSAAKEARQIAQQAVTSYEVTLVGNPRDSHRERARLLRNSCLQVLNVTLKLSGKQEASLSREPVKPTKHS